MQFSAGVSDLTNSTVIWSAGGVVGATDSGHDNVRGALHGAGNASGAESRADRCESLGQWTDLCICDYLRVHTEHRTDDYVGLAKPASGGHRNGNNHRIGISKRSHGLR